jgi:hypothetical protein
MDENFEFWYPIITEVQLGLEGQQFHKEVLKTGHILYSGRLLCGESMEVLKNQVKKTCEAQTIKDKTLKVRVERVGLCQECQRKYKRNNRSAYTAWVEGRPKQPATRVIKA